MNCYHYLSGLLLPLFFLSCGDSNNLPSCIQEVTQLSVGVEIYTQTLDSETHYWIRTGATNEQGDEAIVDADCTQVCHSSQFFPPACFSAYTDNWQLVYP